MGLLQSNNVLADVDMNNPLDKLSKSIKDSVSGLSDQVINPLKSAFETSEGGVALVSESDSLLTKSLTTFKSLNIEKITQGMTNLIGGILNDPNLGNILSYEDGFSVNPSELMRIASQGLGFNVGSTGDLKNVLGDEFMKELDSMTGGMSNSLFFLDQDRLVVRDGYQKSIVESVIGFTARNNEAFAGIVNIAGVNSVLNVMINQAAQNGMYQSYESFGDQYLFQSDYTNALINSMDYCIARGDVKSLEKMLELIGQDGLNKVRAQYPDLIERTLTGFTFDRNTYEEDYPKLSVLLETLLTTVGGNDWYRTSSSYGMVTNLAVVNSISKDAKLLLSSYEKYRPLLCTSGIFRDENALDVFLRDFPKAVKFEH